MSKLKKFIFFCSSLAITTSLCLGLFQLFSSVYFEEFLDKKYQKIKQEYRFGHLTDIFNDRDPERMRYLVPHPYFNYALRTGGAEELSLEARARRGARKVFRVGILGGSVAENQATVLLNSGSLEQTLRGLLPTDVDIEVEKLALGGYRQPIQYNISSMFGELFDLIVNIEGYNELFYLNQGYPPFYSLSSVSRLYYGGTFEGLGLALEMKEAFDKEVSFINRIFRNKEGFSFIRAGLKLGRLFYRAKLNRLGEKVDLLEGRYSFEQLESFYPEGFFQANKEMWFKFSCLQQNVLKALGSSSIFIFQPMLLLKERLPGGIREKSEEHNKIRRTMFPGVSFEEEIQEIHRTNFSKYGLNFYSAAGLFRHEDGAMFRDGCCHLTAEGVERLEAFVNKAIVNHFNKTNGFKERQECNLDMVRKKIRATH